MTKNFYGLFVIAISCLMLISSCGGSNAVSADSDVDGTADTAVAQDETIASDTASDADSQSPVYQLLEAKDAEALINEHKNDPKFHIIDVRTPSEFSGGHIAGAENVNVSDASFESLVGAKPKDETSFVYCASGARSKGAIQKMQALLFMNLYELKGGISSWKSAGLPTTTE